MSELDRARPTSDASSLLSLVVAGGTVALLFATTGPVGAAAGAALTPVVAKLFDQALLEIRGLSARKAGSLISEGATAARVTEEHLLEVILEDPTRIQLLTTTIDVAIRTSMEAKVKVLGRALASGVLADDPARVDEEQLFVQTIGPLEASHLRVLVAIWDGAKDQAAHPHGISEAVLATKVPGEAGPSRPGAHLQPLLRTLEGAGLVFIKGHGLTLDEADDETEAVAHSNSWLLTGYGEYVLDRFRAAGISDGGQS